MVANVHSSTSPKLTLNGEICFMIMVLAVIIFPSHEISRAVMLAATANARCPAPPTLTLSGEIFIIDDGVSGNQLPISRKLTGTTSC